MAVWPDSGRFAKWLDSLGVGSRRMPALGEERSSGLISEYGLAGRGKCMHYAVRPGAWASE